MSSKKSVLARSLVVFGVMLGAAFAAEPIFVSPPTTAESTAAPTPQKPADSLEDLPVAKSYPVTPVDAASQGNTQAQPIFVTTPPAVTPAESGAAPAKQKKTGKAETAVPVAPRPVMVGPPKPPQLPPAPVAEPGEAPAVQKTSGAAATEEDQAAADQPSPVSEAGIENIKLGLGLAPIKVETGLPPELGILQTALEKVVDNTAFLPEAEGQKLLCADANKISGLARELSQTPLIEVTTHFTLWRSAMSDLLGSTEALQRQCQRPSQQSVGAFKKVVEDFSSLLEVR